MLHHDIEKVHLFNHYWYVYTLLQFNKTNVICVSWQRRGWNWSYWLSVVLHVMGIVDLFNTSTVPVLHLVGKINGELNLNMCQQENHNGFLRTVSLKYVLHTFNSITH